MMGWINAVLDINIFGLYSLACMLLPCFIYQFVLVIRMRKEGQKCRAVSLIWIYIFLIYIWMVFEVTGIGVLGDVLRQDTGLIMGEINIRPFDSFGIGYILNVVMCVPFGFLLPFIWKGCRKIGKTVMIGAAFSILIEITQLFNYRATDIDDLTANTLGALIGYGIWKMFTKIFGERFQVSKDKNDAPVYIILAMAGTFFLYNPYLLL